MVGKPKLVNVTLHIMIKEDGSDGGVEPMSSFGRAAKDAERVVRCGEDERTPRAMRIHTSPRAIPSLALMLD